MSVLNEQIKKYLTYCEYNKRLDYKTLKAYKIDLRQFSEFLSENAYPADKDGVEKYVQLVHKKYKPKTAKRKLACIKTFFVYLEFEEEIPANPFTKIKTKFREPFILPKTISLETVKSILNSSYLEMHDTSQSDYHQGIALRDTAVMETLFATGARVSEVCSLRECDIDLNEGIIKIYGKGSKERLIQIGNRDVLNILNKYSAAFQSKIAQSGFFFVNKFGNRLSEQSVRAIINKYAEKSGAMVHITPHMFRHTFATLLLEEDVDIRYIQKFLGHSSIVTTQIYTHVTSKKQKEILVAKHPRNKVFINQG